MKFWASGSGSPRNPADLEVDSPLIFQVRGDSRDVAISENS